MNKNIDIKNIKAAKRYALALSQSVIDNLDEVEENLSLVNEVIFANSDFMNFFSHPIVSLKDKKDTLNETLSGKVHEKTLNFLNTLLDEGRFGIFGTIHELYKQEVDSIKNKQRISVSSVITLEDDEKARLEEKLAKKLQKDVILTYEESEEILGGLLIKFEDKIIDLSLKAKFDDLRKNI